MGAGIPGPGRGMCRGQAGGEGTCARRPSGSSAWPGRGQWLVAKALDTMRWASAGEGQGRGRAVPAVDAETSVGDRLDGSGDQEREPTGSLRGSGPFVDGISGLSSSGDALY